MAMPKILYFGCIVLALAIMVDAKTPPGIAKNPSKATCKIKKYKHCYNLDHVCPKFCPDSCHVECASCKPICGPEPSSPPPPENNSGGKKGGGEKGKGGNKGGDGGNKGGNKGGDDGNKGGNKGGGNKSPPPSTPPPIYYPPTPSTPSSPPPSTPTPPSSPSPSPPTSPTPPSPSTPPTPSTPSSPPPTTPTPPSSPSPSPPTSPTPPSPLTPPTPSTPSSPPPSTPTPPSSPSPSPPYTPSPPSTPPSPPNSSGVASRKRVRCKNKNYGQCYNQPHFCPDNCPTSCQVDCVTCKPVCSCDYPGAVCQDPRFVGADGITFYFHGKKDQDFCLVTDPNLHINAHFIGKRNQNLKRDFTWVESIGILFDNHRLFIGAKKTTTWDDANDRLSLVFNGEPISLDDTWKSTTTPQVTITRTTTETNHITLQVDGKMKITAKVVSITEQESRVHNYGITKDDCFAHLDLGFKFYSLTGKVDGVLGKTYADDYVSKVNVRAAMAVVGGEKEYVSSSIFATDCLASRFDGGRQDETPLEGLDLAHMKCASGMNGEAGVVCKR